MSGINTITGEDTLTLYGRNIVDLASGDVSTIAFNTNRVEMKTGKNNNVIFARNSTGQNCEVVLRLNRGGLDDQFLQQQISLSDQDFSGTILASGQFVKNLGDGLGNKKRDVYTLQGGMITRNVDTKGNSDGDVEQGIATYRMGFAYTVRSIQ